MIDEDDLARTVERGLAAIAEDEGLARTIERRPRGTIAPDTSAAGGEAALAMLASTSRASEGRFVIGETIGEGGMGVVHLAEQATMGRQVAVKTLREGSVDQGTALRVLREAWVTGALEHPNVVPVYDVGLAAGGSPLIVMKRIEGLAWADLLADPDEVRRRFHADDVVEWHLRVLASVCNAVAFAHSRGIIHRDLKPENVMVGAFGEVYVVDWGLAVSLRKDETGRLPHVSDAREVAGTPAYMAPEMLLGDASALGERTDVYLLGAIFYEIFAGAPPHDGEMPAIVSSILLSNPAFPDAFPAEAAQIARRAMAREPADRFAGVDGFREAVLGYLQHRGSRRLAWEAKQSLARLTATLAGEPAGGERDLAVYNLLGECRFGYRAALEAWPENRAARTGLDRALLTVLEHELTQGDPAAASALLRDVAAPPAGLDGRVEKAMRERADEDERLRRLDRDLDPSTGTRTRTAIGSFLGVLWTAVPLWAFFAEQGGRASEHAAIVGLSAGFLALGALLYVWARETMSRTLLNRRLASTLGVHLVAQICLGLGAWAAGLTPHQSAHLHVLAWMQTQLLLGVWIERWFVAPAVFNAATFLVAARLPDALFPLMSASNLVFTIVLVGVWFPRQDLARIDERRKELRTEARRLLFLHTGREGSMPVPPGEGD